MSSEPTYYDILGINSSVDQDEIKRAFRQRALDTHPDRNRHDPASGQAFIRVAQAYETLSDIHKRAAYDFKHLRTRSKTAEYGVTVDDVVESDYRSILDSKADDVLEEYIVGNRPPADTSMGTFFHDLEQTEIFILFRDGKAAYHRGHHLRAIQILDRAIEKNPHNILYHHYLGLALAEVGKVRRAIKSFERAIAIGDRRYPTRLCPGVRRALYDLLVRKKRRIRAWWMRRQQGYILFDDPLSFTERESMRLKKIAYLESLRHMEPGRTAVLPSLPASTTPRPRP